MKKVIILDFETGKVHISNYDEAVFKDFEDDFLEAFNEEHDLQLSGNNCQWMIISELNITVH